MTRMLYRAGGKELLHGHMVETITIADDAPHPGPEWFDSPAETATHSEVVSAAKPKRRGRKQKAVAVAKALPEPSPPPKMTHHDEPEADPDELDQA